MRISGVQATIVRTLTVRIKDLPHDAFERAAATGALGYRIEQKPGEIRATVFRGNPHRAAYQILCYDDDGVAERWCSLKGSDQQSQRKRSSNVRATTCVAL